MEKTFSKLEIAVIKRTAQNVAQFVNKKEKINAKIAELEAEKASIQPIIDSFQGPIKEMTGGYTTEDLVVKEVVKTGKCDPATGKELTQTRFVLKYPETVIPSSAVEDEAPEAVENTVGEVAEAEGVEEIPEEYVAEQVEAEEEAEASGSLDEEWQ